MTSSGSGTGSDSPLLERFSPSAGRWVGVVALTVIAVAAGLVLADGDVGDVAGVLVGLAVAALVTWVALVRPSVQARRDHLLLRNLLRDTEVPWHLVERVRLAQTLRVEAGDRVHHGVAITRSARTQMRDYRDGPGSGSGSHGYDGADGYSNYVVDRLNLLAKDQSAASAGRDRVTHRWAWFELALAVVLGTLALTVALA